ncbi:MAG TPA: multicopper oxidase family protein [Casimicrobiaceae bacterium]|nr:multicopper oxidase family protein [Casimicrobiaceae bacterium]
MSSHQRLPRSPARRRLLQGLTGACALALARASRPDDTHADLVCGNAGSTQPLPQPGASGFLGRIRLDATPLVLRAGAAPPGSGVGALAYQAARKGTFLNPTLVVRKGDPFRVVLDNALDQATIVHWHGFAVDTRNDGGGSVLAAPGERYDYAFDVRNRGGLYWYHPHPHGSSARQLHDGLYGLIDVEDDDTDALRRALDLTPGSTELMLVLRDQDPARRYASSVAQSVHGFYGDALRVNGVACAHADVGTRLYRLRILNACNARTLLLGLRTASGERIAFQVIGNDGGLLPAPVVCAAAFLASAERLDILVDLRDAAIGDTLVLETRAFDPMHAELALPAAAAADEPDPHAGHHAGGTAATSGAPPPATSAADPHAAHGGAWPEGAARDILQLRVRTRVAYDRTVPAQLSTLAPTDVTGAEERPLRLGYKSGRWRINDRVFVMGETPIEVARDTTEIWLLRNYFTSMPHAMHLHGFPFEVLERETSPDQVKSRAIDRQGRLPSDLGRKDTVLVWPGESVRVAVRFDMPFAGAQTYPFHCHNLEHEDAGMMLGVKVA